MFNLTSKLRVFWNYFLSTVAFTDKVERNCHFPAPGWKCMTHRQALQGFPDTSRVSLHKKNKINSSENSGSCREPGSDSWVQIYK
jgi:hypothetical protein